MMNRFLRKAVFSFIVSVFCEQLNLTFHPVGLSMMCYTEEKANSTCFGDFQLRGLIGK